MLNTLFVAKCPGGGEILTVKMMTKISRRTAPTLPRKLVSTSGKLYIYMWAVVVIVTSEMREKLRSLVVT